MGVVPTPLQRSCQATGQISQVTDDGEACLAVPPLSREEVELIHEVLDRGGRLAFQMVGDCMSPQILPGDLLQVEGCPPGSMRWGQVVLLVRNHVLIAHRYWGRVPLSRRILTKGDTGARFDSQLYPSTVLGRVVAVRRVADLEGSSGEIVESMGLLHRLAGLFCGLRPMVVSRFKDTPQ